MNRARRSAAAHPLAVYWIHPSVKKNCSLVKALSLAIVALLRTRRRKSVSKQSDDRSVEHVTCLRHRFWHFELGRWHLRRGGASSVTHPAWRDVGANSPVLQLRR